MKKANKYTQQMVEAIQEVSAVNQGLDLALCEELAERPEFKAANITPRGIVAKARTLGLPYRKVERLTKAGDPVVRKNELVAEIEQALGLSDMDTLAKADKRALVDLYAAIRNLPVTAA